MTGAATDTSTTLRLCVTEGCETRLSRFNPSMKCAACEARLEIGGARMPVPKQPAFPPRPPAPKRPTTDGGMPLPGVVKGRERSYEEMIAKPAATATMPATCAECGKPLAANAEGWLCPRCQGKAVAKLGLVASMEHEHKKLKCKKAASMPAPDAKPQPQRTAPAAKARRRAGAPRRYDHDEAILLFRETGNYTKIANHFGVTAAPIRRLVNSRLDAAEITSIRERFPFPQRGATRRKPAAAAATPADAERRLELARLAAELDEIHNEQTRLYARWRVTAERHAELLRDTA